MHRDDIHIALAEDHLTRSGLLGCKETEEGPALVEDHCLRGVQILGLSLPHNAAAKGDDTAIGIHNGEHGSLPELIAGSSSLMNGDEARVHKIPVTVALGLQVAVEGVGAIARVSQSPFEEGIIGQLTLSKVGHGLASLLAVQHGIVEFSRLLIDL